jgi:hypothetical protein
VAPASCIRTRLTSNSSLRWRELILDATYFVIAASVSSIEVFDMRLSKLRMGIHGIAYVAIVTGLLAGCSGSRDTAATSVTGGGSSNPAPITGIATPSSVSVVTATGAN